MGQNITLTAGDGHRLDAYAAEAKGTRKGGLIVVQEIFGVNQHIRDVCDRYAEAGYESVAPALFDRQERGFESGYSPEEVEKARRFIANPNMDEFLLDVAAARDHLAPRGPVAIVGYCLGGSVAFASATRLDGMAAAIGYYGGMVVKMADETPRCPTMLHFGETDHSISMESVETVRQKRPDVEIFVYPAGHGFSCDHRSAFEPESARLAGERTLAFLETHVAGR